MKTNKKLNRIIAFMILFLMFFNPTASYAHDAYFLNVLIDPGTYQYIGSITFDKDTLTSSERKHHTEPELGNFEDIKSSGFNYESYDKEGSTGKEENYMFTFPPGERVIGGLFDKTKNHANNRDLERAYEIRDTLIPGINSIISIVSQDKPIRNIEEFIRITEKINGSNTNINGWNLSYQGNDVIVQKGKAYYRFRYRMNKGYSNSRYEDGKPSKVYQNKFKFNSRNETITMKDLIIQANYLYTIKGMGVDSIDEIEKESTLQSLITGLIMSINRQVRNLLGLKTVDDLVFSKGIMGSPTYVYGATKTDWYTKALTFNQVIMALMLPTMTVAVVVLILKRALATSNPSLRISLGEGIQDLITAGILLSFNIFIVGFLLRLNLKIVDVLETLVPANSILGGSETGGGVATTGGALIQIYFLIMGLFYNIQYVVRGVSIVALLATGPFFIGKYAFGGRHKQSFYVWLNELIGNIFMQSIQAFLFALLSGLITDTRGIEKAVVLGSIFGLTRLFRSIMLNGAGGMASEIAGRQSAVAGAGVAAGIGGVLANKKKTSPNLKNTPKFNAETSDSETAGETLDSDVGINSKNVDTTKVGVDPSSSDMKDFQTGEKQGFNWRSFGKNTAKFAGRTAMAGGMLAGGTAMNIMTDGQSNVGSALVHAGGKEVTKGINDGYSFISNTYEDMRSIEDPTSVNYNPEETYQENMQERRTPDLDKL